MHGAVLGIVGGRSRLHLWWCHVAAHHGGGCSGRVASVVVHVGLLHASGQAVGAGANAVDALRLKVLHNTHPETEYRETNKEDMKDSNSKQDKSILWKFQEVHFSFFGLHCSISGFYHVLQKNTNFRHHFDWDVLRFDP